MHTVMLKDMTLRYETQETDLCLIRDTWCTICFQNIAFKEEILRLSSENISNDRISHPICSVKKAVLKNFVIFTGKNLCWSLF